MKTRNFPGRKQDRRYRAAVRKLKGARMSAIEAGRAAEAIKAGPYLGS